MTIQLIHSIVTQFSLSQVPHVEKEDLSAEEKSFGLDYMVQYDEDNPTDFSVKFELKIENNAEGYLLEASYVSLFQTSKTIDEEFKNSPFPTVNAPAIAFPFLRSFIATITLNAGYNSVILPSINFVTFRKTKEDSEKD